MRNKNLNAKVQSTLRVAKVCSAKLCRLRVFALKDHHTEPGGMFLLVV